MPFLRVLLSKLIMLVPVCVHAHQVVFFPQNEKDPDVAAVPSREDAVALLVISVALVGLL